MVTDTKGGTTCTQTSLTKGSNVNEEQNKPAEPIATQQQAIQHLVLRLLEAPNGMKMPESLIDDNLVVNAYAQAFVHVYLAVNQVPDERMGEMSVKLNKQLAKTVQAVFKREQRAAMLAARVATPAAKAKAASRQARRGGPAKP